MKQGAAWAGLGLTAIAGIFLSAALLCYGSVLGGPFIWDDQWLAVQNPLIKSPLFIGEVFRHYLFLDSLSAYYRPVQNLSYIFDYWAWGDLAFGFHLTNILLHTAVAVLLVVLLKRLIGAEAGSVPVIAGFIWMIHPIHNAAVAYISGRADSLACLLAVAAWLLYLKASEQKSSAFLYCCASATFFLALCSKEIALVWAALFLMWELRRSAQMGRKMAIVFVLVSIIYGYILVRASVGDRAGLGLHAEPLATRVVLMLRALGDYVWVIFFPDNLHMERMVLLANTWQAHQQIRLEYLSTIGLLAIVALGWGAMVPWRGRDLRRLGAVWFVIGFLPISNLFPLNAQVAEHWIYMPSMGFILFLAGCWRALPKAKTAAVWIVLALACAGLMVRTAVRSADWADPERFFNKTIQSGGGTPRRWLNLAHFYSQSGKPAESEKVLRRMLELFPDYITARVNLGLVLIGQGQKAEGEQLLKECHDTKAAGRFPQSWRGSLRLAREYLLLGEKESAARLLDEALQKNPEIWELTSLRATLQEPKVGLDCVEQFVRKHWWHYSARIELGRLQLGNQMPDAALQSWSQAAWLDVRKSEPYQLITELELERQRPEQALRSQLNALERNPYQPSQHLVLAKIYERLGQGELAASAVGRAQGLASRLRSNDSFKRIPAKPGLE